MVSFKGLFKFPDVYPWYFQTSELQTDNIHLNLYIYTIE